MLVFSPNCFKFAGDSSELISQSLLVLFPYSRHEKEVKAFCQIHVQAKCLRNEETNGAYVQRPPTGTAQQ